jgi:hypothetical protein
LPSIIDGCDLRGCQIEPKLITRPTQHSARALMGPMPGVERLFAAGFSGTGIKTAPALGASMAELILTGTSTTVDLTPFGFERILSGRMIEGPNEYEIGAGFGHQLCNCRK